MSEFSISIDGKKVEARAGETVLDAARRIGIEIPTLCHLEKCGPLTSCQICLVKVVNNGQSRLTPSCATLVTPGMVVESETEEVHEARRTALELLFSDHVGDCLSPCNRLCPLQLNIPVMIRQIQAGNLDDAVRTVRHALPLAGVLARLCHHPCEQGCRRGDFDEPAAIREMEKYLTEHDAGQNDKVASEETGKRPPRAKQSVVIVGSGPAGMTAAHDLVRHGYGVTVIDRAPKPGGSLRNLPDLPATILDAEISLLKAMGIQFRNGIELGRQVTLDGLSRGFDAILLTVGEVSGDDSQKLSVPMTERTVKADPINCMTSAPGVFAAGACVKPIKQLVRVMAEGRAGAECIHRHLQGLEPRRPEKAFSSTMGRVSPAELRDFLRGTNPKKAASPCSSCAALDQGEARAESARCLHCDCRSSGDCLLQHYAQLYGADANRFRSDRRPFEQQSFPNGLIFEPGKCILCGICIKLTEMAGHSPGLTFVGRGFEMRVAAAMDYTVEQGLGNVAEECVRNCPTGALAFEHPSKCPGD